MPAWHPLLRSRWFRRGAVLCVLLMVLAGSFLLVALNRGSLPETMAGELRSYLAEHYGITLVSQGAAFSSPFRFRLQEVSLLLPSAGSDRLLPGPIYMDELQVDINPKAIISGRWQEAISALTLLSPRFELEVLDGDGLGDAELTTGEGGRPGQFGQSGRPGQSAQPSPSSLPGRLGTGALNLRLVVNDGSLLLLFTGRDGTDEVLLEDISGMATASGGSWHINRLSAATTTGRCEIKGRVVGDQLDLELHGDDLLLPGDIPQLATWGIGGLADFTGHLTGSLAKPIIDGDTVIREGTIWHRPVDTATGHITLDFTGRQFQFAEVDINHDQALYELEGVVRWAARRQAGSGIGTSADSDIGAGGNDGHLDLHLHSRRGRAEELLAVLGWALPASGELDGSLQFSGPFGAVTAAGDVVLRQVDIYDEHLDVLAGRFSWGEDGLQINDARLKSGTGLLRANGWTAPDGSRLDFTVEAEKWPLAATRFIQSMAPAWRGELDLSGRLSGTLTDPVFAGRVGLSDAYLGRIGPLQVEGPLSFRDGQLATTGMKATADDGGTWVVQGKIDNVRHEPIFDISLKVANQTLSSVLAMGGWRLPIMLVDGAVHGDIRLSGAAHDPEAMLKLYLAHSANSGKEALRLELLIKDRRVEVLHFG